MITLVSAAFLLGFLGSMHCVGMCGGLVSTLAMSQKRVWWTGLMSYQLGRILTYTFLGLLAGMLGMVITQVSWIADMQRSLTILAGLLMIGFGLSLAGWMPDPFVKFMSKFSRLIGLTGWVYAATNSRMPMSWFMVGLFNGLLPCGLVYAGLALSLTSGSIGLSAAMMLSFGLGTVPAMMFVPIILQSASPNMRGIFLKVAALLLIAMGMFTMIRGSTLMHSMHDMKNMKGMNHSEHMMNHDMKKMDHMNHMDMNMDNMKMGNP
ncbi:MAG: sulfite exporter TauE/SafE family protein [Ghiorsea sp.]|nr:sulfite exporter TauE/SafE family protein [Ghiorsea sp.]